LKDASAATSGFRRRLFAAGGVFVLTLLAAGSTRLADTAPYLARSGADEVIPMVLPNPAGMRHAAYPLFGERRHGEDSGIAQHPLAVTSVCLTTEDAFARRLLVCSIRDPAARQSAIVKAARVGRIR
jgi:hypothetical protein